MSFAAVVFSWVYLWLFVLNINLAWSQSRGITITAAKGNLEFVQSESSCGEDEFQCRNRQCIQDKLLCDGRADCSDQSDETRVECTKPEIICPGNSFRCDYGACVSADVTCDGVKDCLDNTDELLEECPRPPPPVSILSRLFDIQPYREPTRTLTRREINKVKVRKSKSTPKTLVPFKSSRLYSFCVVPPQPQYGQWKLHEDLCNFGDECNISQGTRLTPNSQLVYSCAEYFELVGNDVIYCLDGGNWSPIPTCIATRCSPVESIWRSVKCYDEDQEVGCDIPSEPGTKAEISCNFISFSKSRNLNYSLTLKQNVECSPDLKWKPKPISCLLECGMATNSEMQGTLPEVGAFPWHANLWRESTSGKAEFEYRCGATIINARFVLTAAHCILTRTGTIIEEDSDHLRVTVGNAVNELDFSHTSSEMVHKVKNTYRLHRDSGNWSPNIALVELSDPIEFSTLVSPVCFDDFYINNWYLEPGVTAKFSGSGKTCDSTHSRVLQTVKAAGVSRDECKKCNSLPYNPIEDTPMVFDTEFCAVYSNETTICDWDSGSGLVVKRGKLWFLAGVFNVDLGVDPEGTDETCGRNPYLLYTTVFPYAKQIQDIINNSSRFDLSSSLLIPLSAPTIQPPVIQTRTTTPTSPTSPTPQTTGSPINLTTEKVEMVYLVREAPKFDDDDDEDIQESPINSTTEKVEMVYLVREAPKFDDDDDEDIQTRTTTPTSRINPTPQTTGSPTNSTTEKVEMVYLVREAPKFDDVDDEDIQTRTTTPTSRINPTPQTTGSPTNSTTKKVEEVYLVREAPKFDNDDDENIQTRTTTPTSRINPTPQTTGSPTNSTTKKVEEVYLVREAPKYADDDDDEM